MRALRGRSLVALLSSVTLLGGASPLLAAENLALKRCGKISVVADTDGGPETYTDLSDSPSIICSVDFMPSATNGFVRLVDSPDDTITHAHAVTVAEVGGTTVGLSNAAYYGEYGRLTQYGLEAEVRGGTAIISWDD